MSGACAAGAAGFAAGVAGAGACAQTAVAEPRDKAANALASKVKRACMMGRVLR